MEDIDLQEQTNALDKPRQPRTRQDWIDRLYHDPDLSNIIIGVQAAEKVELTNLKPGDLLLMRTEDESSYAFIVSEDNNLGRDYDDLLTGLLILSPEVSQRLGVEQTLPGVKLKGSSPSGTASIILGRLVQGTEAEFYIPITVLGAPLLAEEDEEKYLKYQTTPIRAVNVTSLKSLPSKPAVIGELEAAKVGKVKQAEKAIREVHDWPGKESENIELKDIFAFLYGERSERWIVQSHRGAFWINPRNGLITYQGKLMDRCQTVWDLIDNNLDNYRECKDRRYAARIAMFTYWALKLGLKLPQYLMEEFRALNLEFSLK